jgi:hypothetical protein
MSKSPNTCHACECNQALLNEALQRVDTKDNLIASLIYALMQAEKHLLAHRYAEAEKIIKTALNPLPVEVAHV